MPIREDSLYARSDAVLQRDRVRRRLRFEQLVRLFEERLDVERRRLDRALLPELHGRPRRYDPDLHAEPPQPHVRNGDSGP